MMDWFTRVMRKSTAKLLISAMTPQKNQDKNVVQANVNDFIDVVLDHSENQLSTTKFLTGKEIAIVDIIVYCEMQTVLHLYSLQIDSKKYSHLAAWHRLIGSNEAM